MEAALVTVLLGVVPALLVIVAVVAILRLGDAKRQRGYAAFCLARGYEYQPSRQGVEAQYTGVVPLFKVGGSHAWRHEISGRLNGRSLPHFTLVPTNTYLFRFGNTPSAVEFPDDAAFAKAYILSGQDEAPIRALFTAALCAALAAAPGQFVAGGGQDLFWWLERRLAPPDQLDKFLSSGDWVVTQFAAGLAGRA